MGSDALGWGIFAVLITGGIPFIVFSMIFACVIRPYWGVVIFALLTSLLHVGGFAVKANSHDTELLFGFWLIAFLLYLAAASFIHFLKYLVDSYDNRKKN